MAYALAPRRRSDRKAGSVARAGCTLIPNLEVALVAILRKAIAVGCSSGGSATRSRVRALSKV